MVPFPVRRATGEDPDWLTPRPSGCMSAPMTETTDEIRPKRLFIKTYGCQMNVYDSDRMADALAPHGYEPTRHDGRCRSRRPQHLPHPREGVARKSSPSSAACAELRAEGRDFMIGVAGCVAQAEGEEIARRAKCASTSSSARNPITACPISSRAPNAAQRVVETEFPEEDKFEHLPAAQKQVTRSRGLTAFLTVQEGCDKFCSFCVVPYTRGAETSRPVEQVLAEARNLVEAGVRETHAARPERQRLSRPRRDAAARVGLGELCDRLAEIDGLARIRYTTSHPSDMSDELIAAHRDNRQR